MLYVIEGLEAEVNNGGFHQYLFNSAGDHASEAAAALEAVGARSTAKLVRRAMTLVFGEQAPPSAREDRIEVLEGLSENDEDVLNELDNEFYDYPDDIANLSYAYIEANRGSIRGTLPPVDGVESEPSIPDAARSGPSFFDRLKGLFGKR